MKKLNLESWSHAHLSHGKARARHCYKHEDTGFITLTTMSKPSTWKNSSKANQAAERCQQKDSTNKKTAWDSSPQQGTQPGDKIE